uniref:Stage 0 sporulation family protein n=1 Tax=Anaerolinea thermolimosa TaxID=229919 RepID=A0A7C4PJ34_9CHLR
MNRIVSPVIVGVRFSKVGKIYHFDASMVPDVQPGDSVVVETSRGWQIGTVVTLEPTPETPPEGLKQIDRRATPRDLAIRDMWKAKEPEVLAASRKRASELNLVGVKIIAADYSFDGSRLSIMFSSETDEKVDMKSLRQDMQRQFAPAQVELRQIGPRDVAKLLGGMGACGLEQRCCSQFLCEFSSISIKMAKEQGISLTPTEITGMCGRLRCCLIYEYQQYADARAQLPKRNKRVMTPDGEGRVIDVVPLRESAIVEFPDGIRREVKKDQLTIIDEGSPLPARPEPSTEETELESEEVEEVPEEDNNPSPNDSKSQASSSQSRSGRNTPPQRQQPPSRGKGQSANGPQHAGGNRPRSRGRRGGKTRQQGTNET